MTLASRTAFEWINHSGFLLRSGDVCLVSDPWLSGEVFADGWSLVLPSKMTGEEIGARATHIWLSHEHPDHFHPPSLKAIPEADRRRIRLLFQATRDRRVAGFCRSLGFTVDELEPDIWYDLGSRNSIFCHKIGINSTLIHRTPTAQLVNVNDCGLREADFETLDRELSSSTLPRILLTQFSYAHWCGNVASVSMRSDEAARKLADVKRYVDRLRPDKLVLFASFIYFSHAENFFANDSINRPSTALDHLVREGVIAEEDVVILLPGERWDCESDVKARQAAETYDAAFDRIRPGPARGTPLTREELAATMGRFRARIRDYFGAWTAALRLLYAGFELRVRITDADVAIRLSPFGFKWGERSTETNQAVDLELSSDALRACLGEVYGFNSVHVASRFQVGHPRGLDRALLAFLPSDHIRDGRPRSAALLRVAEHRGLLLLPMGAISRLPLLRRFARPWWSQTDLRTDPIVR